MAIDWDSIPDADTQPQQKKGVVDWDKVPDVPQEDTAPKVAASTETKESGLSLSDLITGKKPQQPPTSEVKTAVKSAAESVLPAAGAVASFGAGASLGATAVSPISAAAAASGVGAPAVPFIEGAGALLGGTAASMGAGYLVQKAQDKVLDLIPENVKAMVGMDKATRARENAENPKSAFFGNMAGSLPFLRPGVSTLKQIAAGVGIGGGLEATREMVEGGKIDPTKVAMAAVFQGVSSKPTKLGQQTMDFVRSLAPTAGKAAPVVLEKQAVKLIPVDPTESKEAFVERKLKEVEAIEQARKNPGDPKLKAQDEALGKAGLTPQSGRQMSAVERQSYISETEGVMRTSLNSIAAQERIRDIEKHSIQKNVPEDARREAISDALDKGNMSELTPDETKVAQGMRSKFNDLGKQAEEAGVIKGLRENYITYIVDWKKSGVTPTQALLDKITGSPGTTSTKSKFGREGKYESFDELQDAIKNSGLVLRTKDIAEIWSTYSKSMDKAIITRNMVEQLKGISTPDGQKLLKSLGPDTSIRPGWKVFPGSAMAGYAVHPDIAPALNFVFGQGDTGLMLRGAYALSMAAKKVNVTQSLFHAKSLTESLILSRPLGFMRDVVTGFAGQRTAYQMFKNGGAGDLADLFIRDGLTLGAPPDVSTGVVSRIGSVVDDTVARLGGKTNLEAKGGPVDKVLDLAHKFTFDVLLPSYKLATATHMYEQAVRKNPGIDPQKLRTDVARHVNNIFGGQNWFDVATQASTEFGKRLAMEVYSPKGRMVSQLSLFAPDWTVSTIKGLTSAFNKDMIKHPITAGRGIINPTNQADFARRYQLGVAMSYFVIMDYINLQTAGRHIWENKDPTRIEFRDGTSMQVAKHAMEPYEWMRNPERTLAAKLGFLPKAASTMLTGREYIGIGAPELEDDSFMGRLKAVAQEAAPFQLQSTAQAPEGEGVNRAILGSLGFPVYGKTEKQKKEERRRRAAIDKAKREAYRVDLRARGLEPTEELPDE